MLKLATNALKRFKPRPPENYDSAVAYQNLLDLNLAEHGEDRDLAFAYAIGSVSMELFEQQGDAHVLVLRHRGLQDGMTIYDLGCGCGRTAQALARSGWKGGYIGSDIIQDFITELKAKCPPGYEAFVHRQPTIRAADGSLDMIYHWSVFTHLAPEECFLYLRDSFRAMKPGGKIVFSFLEITEPLHDVVFDRRVDQTAKGKRLALLDTFLHREWITAWAQKIGFTTPEFTGGADGADHPPFWQTLAYMTKPL